MRQILAIKVQDEPGVLTRVATVFSSRGFNIDSIAVGATEKLGISRIILVLTGDDLIIEQISKQLNKLVQIIEIKNLTKKECIERQLMLIKYKCPAGMRHFFVVGAPIVRARIIDIGNDWMTFEVSGNDVEIDAFKMMYSNYEILELVVTGKICIEREISKFESKLENIEISK
uniref:Acetolactate synthase small subunit n=1 Tax=Neotessella volvocina TaxID=52559 RepID=A0A3G2R027_9STRA|nr:acetohydroxyacid synthase small subunit [Neotessella volvocina]